MEMDRLDTHCADVQAHGHLHM